MAEKEPVTRKPLSADWFMRGALAKIGDSLDRFTGRNWQPSSSLATSQLVEKLRSLLDAEKKEVAGKGYVVPHNIKLKMQWDKFSADEGKGLDKLKAELLTAAADHINDNLYYTYAPLHLEVKPDYFTEGVKLLVSYDTFSDDNAEAEMNVTMPLISPAAKREQQAPPPARGRQLRAVFSVGAKQMVRNVAIPQDGRLTVGRAGTNGLMIDDNSVSKVHASISVGQTGQLTVADTGSTNGTFINGERIAYGKAVPFSSTDRVGFGSIEVDFTLIEPEPEQESVSEPYDSVQIDGLEFRSRTGEQPASVADADAPVSASKLETQKMEARDPQNDSSKEGEGERE